MTDYQIISALKKALSRPIAFHRLFAEVGGGATEGLFLSQAFYWSERTSNAEGWFYKTQEEWHKETALTRREQESARKVLLRKNILEEKREGLPAKLFFRVNTNILFNLILSDKPSNPDGCQFVTSDKPECQIRQTRMSDSPNLFVISDIQSIYTEITPEITCIDYLHERGGQEVEEQEEEEKGRRKSNSELSASPVNKTEFTQQPEDLNLDQVPPSPPFEKSEQSNEQIKPLSKYANASQTCDRMFEPLPGWRNSKKRNDYKADFVAYLKQKYLPTTSHYKTLTVTDGDAKGWIAKREFDEQGLADIESRFEVFVLQQRSSSAPSYQDLARSRSDNREVKPVRLNGRFAPKERRFDGQRILSADTSQKKQVLGEDDASQG